VTEERDGKGFMDGGGGMKTAVLLTAWTDAASGEKAGGQMMHWRCRHQQFLLRCLCREDGKDDPPL